MKTLFYTLILCCVIIQSCSGPVGRRPIPPCKTAARCSELLSKQENKCPNPFTDKTFYIKNNHPSKKMVIGIERYQQKMYVNYQDGDQSFVESDIIILNGNQEAYLGCEFEDSFRNDDQKWLKNVYVIKKACFWDDTTCRVTDPIEEPEPRPFSCSEACSDPQSEFCVKDDICSLGDMKWLNNELFRLYQRLSTANLARDDINMEVFAPKLIGYCGSRHMNITSRSVLIQGQTCSFHFPTTHSTVTDVWLRLPSLASGEIWIDYNNTVDIRFSKDHESPILVYEVLDQTTNTKVVKQELVEKLTFDRNYFSIEGKTSRCFEIEYCESPDG